MPFLSPGRPPPDSHPYEPISSEPGDDNALPSREVRSVQSQCAGICFCCYRDTAPVATCEETEKPPSVFQRWKDGEFTIVPENNPAIDAWDVLVIFGLLSTALLLPFEVALISRPPLAMYIVDKCIDGTFMCDIVLTFNVAYSLGDPSRLEAYEKAPLKIARYYMAIPFSDDMKAGWFWVDTLTVFPWDLFLSAQSEEELRLLRVLRLLRMFRLVRVVKLFRRWHTHVGFPYALVTVVKCLGSMFLIVHWLACYWAYLGQRRSTDDVTWLSRRIELEGRALESTTPIEMYNLALCFVVEIITTVGLGDIGPTNSFEVWWATLTMLGTGLVWAWVVATFVNILENTDVYTARFNQIMDDLNGVMHARQLDHNLRYRLRKHLHEAFLVHRARHQQQTIQYLSAGLQGEVAIQSGMDKVCDCIWYLKNLSKAVLIDIAQRFESDMFSPNELIIDRTSASVIRKGTCFHKGKVLTRDSAIGLDMILDSEHLRDTVYPRTVTFVEVMTLTRGSLVTVCGKHPEFSRTIRKAQVRLAICRGIIWAARAERARRESKGSVTRRASLFSMDGCPAAVDHRRGKDMLQDVRRSSKNRLSTPGFSNAASTPLIETCKQEVTSVTDVVAEFRSLNRRLADNHSDIMTRLERMEYRMDKLEASASAVDRARSRNSETCTTM